ncbi:hypothetical protein BC834DRAFT_343480 [Gloeopeniophorella convolvens]|nr:hypothetical protein BC834DRAFT_343480 [Gloeopeniophorella convolvens]
MMDGPFGPLRAHLWPPWHLSPTLRPTLTSDRPPTRIIRPANSSPVVHTRIHLPSSSTRWPPSTAATALIPTSLGHHHNQTPARLLSGHHCLAPHDLLDPSLEAPTCQDLTPNRNPSPDTGEKYLVQGDEVRPASACLPPFHPSSLSEAYRVLSDPVRATPHRMRAPSRARKTRAWCMTRM